jgi:predicted DNA-binding transcriptional regulator AlpA
LFVLSWILLLMRSKNGAVSKLGQIGVDGEGNPFSQPGWEAGVGANLTEFWNDPMMPTLDPRTGKANRGPEGNRMAVMQGAVSDQAIEPLLTADEVAERLRVSRDWVWDHSSRRLPYLPVIRMSDGALRYRPSEIQEFLNERARATEIRRKRR